MSYWQFHKSKFLFKGTAGIRFAASLLLVILSVSQTQAISTDPNLSQLMHQQWQTEEGLPQNAVHCLAQDHHGFLWFGTENGLVRFDGNSFDIFTEQSEPAVPHNFVSSLLVARDGTIWAGTRTGGLCRYRDGNFDIPAVEFVNAKVMALAESSDGQIWVGTLGGLLRWDGNSVVRHGIESGFPSTNITALLHLPDGALLAGTAEGHVVRQSGARFETIIQHPRGTQGTPVRSLAYDAANSTLWIAHDGAGLFSYRSNVLNRTDLVADQELEFLRALLVDHEGVLWIATETGGIIRLRNGAKIERSETSNFLEDDVLALLQDRERSIWVGTHFSGLNRLRKGKAVTLTEREGLKVPTVTCVAQEDQKTLWVGTKGGGLMKFVDRKFTSQSLDEEGFPLRRDVRSLLKASTGELWIGTHGGGLGRLSPNGELQFFTIADGLGENLVSSLIEVNGDIWIGTVKEGICVYESASGRIRQLPVPDFLRTHIRAFVHNPEGGLWIASQKGLVSYTEGSFTQVKIPGLPDASVRSLLSEADGTLWLGTRDDGLLRIRAGKVTHYNFQKRLIHNRIYHMLLTADELYLAGNQGIERISLANLEAVADGTEDKLNTRLYGKKEGLRSNEVGEDSTPSALLASDGSMWFGTRKGLSYLAVPTGEKQPPPNVIIKSVTLDKIKLSVNDFKQILPGQSRLHIEYTALSLRNPANVFFKYKLDKVDPRWQEAGRVREAVYYNLEPGSYTFRVPACNDEGVWNETGATLAFTVVPTIYQTAWFQAFGVITACAAVIGAFRWRVRQIRSRNKTLQILVTERTKELQTLNEELESRVRARTAELRSAYENLQFELHERQEAEHALARSEARLRRMVDSGMVGISFWHRSGAITEANDTFLKMVGYTQEELERGELSWETLTPPEHIALDAIALKEIERTGVCTPFEKEYICKDGSRIPILIGGASLGRESDKGVCFVLDISKLKETEEEIRQLNLKLEARVHERTLELARTNEQLAGEVQERKRVGEALAAFSRLGQDLHAARTEKEAAQIVAQTAKSLIPHDVCSLELYTTDGQLAPLLDSGNPESSRIPRNLKCSISVPIRNGARVVGVLGLMNSQSRAFGTGDAGT
ncbi:MAG: ligand-binding sensor domain-containing protein, partial [Limisphaerales bacterium]